MPHFPASAIILAASSAIAASVAIAAPRVATDIAPVHSLAAQVMDGIGAPDLILPTGASPHGYSMRPSEAAALQDAEIVFWVGEGLTPWLERSLENLSGDAMKVELSEAEGAQFLPFRDNARFEAHDEHHGEHRNEHGDHGDEHDDGDHADHNKLADHADDHHAGHDHEGQDPHAWLDPEIAKIWLGLMATTLATADPANAGAYTANAAAAKARIDAAAARVKAQLSPVQGVKYVVFHDAYQYFERHFDIPASGAIALSDASKPGPARIAEIREFVKHDKITCVFTEPQFNAGVVEAVFEGTGVRTGVLDPLGSALRPGATFYGALLEDMAANMAECLGD